MADYTKTTFDDADAHLKYVLGIDLKSQLVSSRWHHLKAWSIITPLVALYRYAELLPEKVKIYDMVAQGHKSHTSGTDLDYGYASEAHRKKAVHQARIIHDMLELREVMTTLSSSIKVFRIGFYFDRFDNDDNLKKMQKAEDKDEKFHDLYKHRTWVSSLHLGLRYDYNSEIYHGATMSKSAGKFGFWGQTGDGFERGMKWAKVFREMQGNISKGHAHNLATKVLDDFRELDLYPPGVARGREPLEPYMPEQPWPPEGTTHYA
ncbi:MAG: hypothetical protein AAFW98_00775 [Pseudomonadota bacterium]